MSDFDPLISECDLCGSQDIHLLTVDYKGIQIYKCRHCHIEFMNPQYSEQYLKELYSSYYRSDQDYQHDKKEEKLKKHLHELNIIDVEKFTAVGNFLSVGCGNGCDLISARKRGWQVEGFEVDPVFSKSLKSKLDMIIRSGNFVDLEYPEEHYNCIYLSHVIEHVKNPAAYLKKFHQLLKKQGILYISCPNIACLSIRAKRLMEQLNLKSKKGSYYDTWHHIFYFRPTVLKDLLENQYGFKVLFIANDRKFKSKQSVFSRCIANFLSYKYPYKASFRLIAQKV